MSELCLGTVQFGMKYGINNKFGQPSERECFEILDLALENGISVIDTARAYGTSELVLGHYIEQKGYHNRLEFISKLRPNIIEKGVMDKYTIIRNECEDSLKRLHINKLKGYLLHTPEYIYDNEIVNSLQRLKQEGLVENIGVSIYDIKEGFYAIEKGVDYIQLPYNILDQRGEQTGFIEKAKMAGIKIFVRSAFLQGLFMMEINEIPLYLKRAKPYLMDFEKLLHEYDANKIESLLQFIKMNDQIDFLVLGVDTCQQLKEDICYFRKKSVLKEQFNNKLKEQFKDVDEHVILPSLWSGGKKAD